jgi:hypothetical protein
MRLVTNQELEVRMAFKKPLPESGEELVANNEDISHATCDVVNEAGVRVTIGDSQPLTFTQSLRRFVQNLNILGS